MIRPPTRNAPKSWAPLTNAMAELLDVLRKACLPAIWTQGVKLVRGGAVLREGSSANELTFRVRAPGLAVAPTVTLYPLEGEWSCDCGGRVDPCAHVAAAAIAAEKVDGAQPADSAPDKRAAWFTAWA